MLLGGRLSLDNKLQKYWSYDNFLHFIGTHIHQWVVIIIEIGRDLLLKHSLFEFYQKFTENPFLDFIGIHVCIFPNILQKQKVKEVLFVFSVIICHWKFWRILTTLLSSMKWFLCFINVTLCQVFVQCFVCYCICLHLCLFGLSARLSNEYLLSYCIMIYENFWHEITKMDLIE